MYGLKKKDRVDPGIVYEFYEAYKLVTKIEKPEISLNHISKVVTNNI
jgi:hypothetical protein